MKRIGKFLTIFAVAMTLLPINARAAELLIPVGKIVGLQSATIRSRLLPLTTFWAPRPEPPD